jgi:transcriptional regulator with XRE-family HTH domain
MKQKISNSEKIPEFQQALDSMPAESRIFVDKSLAIANYLQLLMQHRRLRQKDLAALMGKSEAELSKWLAGMHNFTLRSLAKLEAALGENIIFVPTDVEIPTPHVAEPIHVSWDEQYTEPRKVASPVNYHPPAEVQHPASEAEETTNALAA